MQLNLIGTKLDGYYNVLEKAKKLVLQESERKVIEVSQTLKSIQQKWTKYKESVDRTKIERWCKSDYFDLGDGLANLKVKINEVHDEVASVTDDNVATATNRELALTKVEVIENEMEYFMKARNLAQAYSAELNALSAKMWICLRNDLSEISQFFVKWKKDIVQLNEANVEVGVFQNLEEIGSLVPILKYCTGELFKEVHWTELLQGRLQLSTDISIENLLFRHFIEANEILLQPCTIAYIEDLQTR